MSEEIVWKKILWRNPMNFLKIRQRFLNYFKNIDLVTYSLYLFSSILIIVSWDLIDRFEFFKEGFAGPMETIEQLKLMMERAYAGVYLTGHIWISTKRVLMGFALASVLTIPLGLAMGLNKYVRAIVKPLFDMFKPMPPIAWVSLVLLWFGVGELGKVFIIFIGCCISSIATAYQGVKLVDQRLFDVIRMLGGTSRHETLLVSLPAALPAIFAGLQLTISGAWMCLIAAELLAARSGVGFIILLGMQLSRPAMSIAGMLIIAILGAVSAKIIGLSEKLLCPWFRDVTKF